MNNWKVPKPSLEELARNADSVLLAGCGGGSDIIQTVNVYNYLKILGVKNICFATISCAWWGEFAKGKEVFDMGCEVMDLDWFRPAERISSELIRILPETQLTGGLGKGRLSYEMCFAKLYSEPVYAVSLRAGLPGVKRAFERIIKENHCDLFITVDIGADTFYSGSETQVCSPLVDIFSVIAASDLGIDGVYALNGYGGDCELHLADLHKNVGRVMKQGGYLGASGITQKDICDLERIRELMGPNCVEDWPYHAAKGEMGVFYSKRFWSMERVPAAAVTFYFDPDVICEFNPVSKAVRDTKTLEEAENSIWEKCNLIPETRMHYELILPTPPQVPDGHTKAE